MEDSDEIVFERARLFVDLDEEKKEAKWGMARLGGRENKGEGGETGRADEVSLPFESSLARLLSDRCGSSLEAGRKLSQVASRWRSR